MKKTKYFKKMCSYSNTIQFIDQLISEKETFIGKNTGKIARIDSEDLRVDLVGNNQAICIIRLTYFAK